MKYIATTLLLIATALIFSCGPHFLGRPEPYHPEPAAQTAPVPVEPAPQNITVTLPNWPAWGYAIDGAIVILLVRDPATFPVPEQFSFQPKEGPAILMPRVQPTEKK